MVDVAVPFVTSFDALPAIEELKTKKYKHLTPVLCQQFGARSVEYFGFQVGARGKWHSGNDKLLQCLGLSPTQCGGFAKLVSRRALEGSLEVLRDFMLASVE